MRTKAVTLFVAFAVLCGTSFAAGNWVTAAGIALATSATLLAVVYMIGMGFGMNDLKFLANEEAYQLIVTIMIAGALLGTQAYLDDLARAMGLPPPPSGGSAATTLQQGALNVIDRQLSDHQKMYDNLHTFSVELGKQSSKSYYCSLQGVGFTASACGALRALSTPVATSYQALGLSITELSSLRTLVQFSQQYAFTLLLPVGILLRTFKLSRGGGGLFIGLAVALYFFLPIALAFMYVVLDPTTGYNPAPLISNVNDFSLPEPDCSEDHFSTWGGGVDYDNYNKAVDTFGYNVATSACTKGLCAKIRTYVYYFLIRGTLTTIVGLLTVYSSLRMISKAAGAEIDISALARIA